MDAGNKGLQRLEVIRQLNGKNREWVNCDLYRLMLKEDLYILAYERLKSKPGNMTPGTDEETLDGFSEEEIGNLINQMRTEAYQPRPVRTTYIPKANGKMRKLGIPCPKDKIVQEVVRMILEAIYDSPHGPYFSDNSHGFRRSRSCHTALREIQKRWSGVAWFIEGDIKSCFDDIDHEVLTKILRKKIKDERFITIIRKFLKAGYQDIDRVRKDSLAGTPQGGIISPILANIYLHELDNYVEQLMKEHEKGKERKLNPKYRSLQRKRLALIKKGHSDTQEFRELTKQMRKLPSVDPQDPNFIRMRFVRYADDWLCGITGSHQLAKEIKDKIGQFLKTELNLTLSQEKTKITSARREEADFLGFKVRLGRSNRAEQKITESTNWTGVKFKRRSTGMEIVLKAPLEKVIKNLSQKGFCDARGNPVDKKAWVPLDEDQIINLYSSINRGIQEYYRPVDNWAALQRVQYILKFSLAKTLAHKRKTTLAQVIKAGEITTVVSRKGNDKTITFYRNEDWRINRMGFSEAQKVDLVQMNLRLRTRSKLGMPCCICGQTKNIQMHHVRHIRRLSDNKAQGFTRVLAILNRKQVPVCVSCHHKIHAGKYDEFKLTDLAYDPRKPDGAVIQRLKAEGSSLKAKPESNRAEVMST